MANVSNLSKWYPYIKVQNSYYDLTGGETIPRKICDYLIDPPQNDYKPIDDNNYPRTRLWKYLYYDTERPLDNKLPTIKQKMAVVFKPEKAEKPPQKGWRLIPQIYIKQAEEAAQTRINCFMGRTVPQESGYKLSISLVFVIWTNYTYELNTKSDAYSRCFAIEQCLIEALHGVNIDGIGTIFFDRNKHPDCQSMPIDDGEETIGRQITFALEIATTADQTLDTMENIPYVDHNKTIGLW